MNKRSKIQIKNESVLYSGWSTLKKYVLEYTRDDGRVETQVREIYNSGDGAAVLMYDLNASKVLLIQQFRLAALLHGHYDGFIYECCAGMLDDLSPQDAIIKEIYEETGYRVADVQKIYEGFATPGAHMEKIHFYVCAFNHNHQEHHGGGEVAEQEEIWLKLVDFDEVEAMLDSGTITDAKTIILLQWALLYLVKRG